MSNAIATWIIAGAAIANVGVYLGMWLTMRKDFVESHKPALAILIRCEYAENINALTGRIAIANHGTAGAHQVNLRLSFATVGFNIVKKIGPVAIQPGSNLLEQPFSFSMTPDVYKLADTDGNRLMALIEGSYGGIGGRTYPYNERQEYYAQLSGFVPTWAG